LGAVSNEVLSRHAKALGIETVVVGDAKRPRKISDAVFEGFEAALNI
jgi:hypothetical protein